jgi:hypothetical protein
MITPISENAQILRVEFKLAGSKAAKLDSDI